MIILLMLNLTNRITHQQSIITVDRRPKKLYAPQKRHYCGQCHSRDDDDCTYRKGTAAAQKHQVQKHNFHPPASTGVFQPNAASNVCIVILERIQMPPMQLPLATTTTCRRFASAICPALEVMIPIATHRYVTNLQVNSNCSPICQ